MAAILKVAARSLLMNGDVAAAGDVRAGSAVVVDDGVRRFLDDADAELVDAVAGQLAVGGGDGEGVAGGAVNGAVAGELRLGAGDHQPVERGGLEVELPAAGDLDLEVPR